MHMMDMEQGCQQIWPTQAPAVAGMTRVLAQVMHCQVAQSLLVN